jgi:GNAT superfamily N-acetyltransferase
MTSAVAVHGPDTPFSVRTHRPGDLGYIVHRHGALYSKEYNYAPAFEALVARIAADFIDNFDAAKERCWIAERDGTFLGCVMLVQDPSQTNTAKLRILLVEPTARGLGVGRSLVRHCVEFAKQAGYRRIVLWTQSDLLAARKLYTAEGFVMVRKDSHIASFTSGANSEHWELDLAATDGADVP